MQRTGLEEGKSFLSIQNKGPEGALLCNVLEHFALGDDGFFALLDVGAQADGRSGGGDFSGCGNGHDSTALLGQDRELVINYFPRHRHASTLVISSLDCNLLLAGTLQLHVKQNCIH